MEQEAKTTILTQKEVATIPIWPAEEMEVIKSNVIKNIMAVLPEFLQELVLWIIEKPKALTNENITKGLETCHRSYLTTLMSIKKLTVLFVEIITIGRRNLKSEKMFITSLHVVTS